MKRKKENIGLLFNTQKKEAIQMAVKLLSWGSSNHINFMLPQQEAASLNLNETEEKVWKETVSFAVVLGGDGTFLRAARFSLGYKIPLYGINLGRLGFLATGSPKSAINDIKKILINKYSLQKRSLLKGHVIRDNQIIHELHALNDFVITNSALARVIDLEVTIENEILSLYLGDGLIISTPTGSTAYALSTGGPIIPPHVPCMLLAPICPHSLYTRPVVLSSNDILTVTPKGNARNLVLTQDGQIGYGILPDDIIKVKLDSDLHVYTIELEGRSYYDTLKKKLRWCFNAISDGGDMA
jgi:NAD+ kinase